MTNRLELPNFFVSTIFFVGDHHEFGKKCHFRYFQWLGDKDEAPRPLWNRSNVSGVSVAFENFKMAAASHDFRDYETVDLLRGQRNTKYRTSRK